MLAFFQIHVLAALFPHNTKGNFVSPQYKRKLFCPRKLHLFLIGDALWQRLSLFVTRACICSALLCSALLCSALVFNTGCDQITDSLKQAPLEESVHLLSDSTDNSIILPEYFEFFGEAHNDGLEYIFSNVIQGNTNLQLTQIKAASYYFFDSVYSTTSIYPSLPHHSYRCDSVLNKAIQQRNSLFLDGFDYGFLSEQEIFFLNKLDDIIGSNGNLNSKLAAIHDLNQEIYDSEVGLNDIQLARLYSTNSVANSSLTYWHSEKAIKWHDFFKSDDSTAPGYELLEVNWGNVAHADVGAFITNFHRGVAVGACRGAIIACLSSGGTMTMVGAILGGIQGGCSTALPVALAASSAALAVEVLWNGW